MDCLSEEVLDNEFSDESRVWVVLDAAAQGDYLQFPKNESTLAVWGFMKKEDAEHMAYIIKRRAKAFADMSLAVAPDLLKAVREGGKKYDVPICILSPNDAKEFFDRYEQFLAHYYGIED